ncbi:hypothetical protein PoB_004219200 [Plakobranchus ocellatus]|uniref:Uncharacterized protein n=1 Tax=Plakobranchus ocellatus TaxID=259542 RepID=A0AAV4B915_9GAST|nr:hypothetical protein PoB_004219200 [Plakobranchus ocellatus]
MGGAAAQLVGQLATKSEVRGPRSESQSGPNQYIIAPPCLTSTKWDSTAESSSPVHSSSTKPRHACCDIPSCGAGGVLGVYSSTSLHGYSEIIANFTDIVVATRDNLNMVLFRILRSISHAVLISCCSCHAISGTNMYSSDLFFAPEIHRARTSIGTRTSLPNINLKSAYPVDVFGTSLHADKTSGSNLSQSSGFSSAISDIIFYI